MFGYLTHTHTHPMHTHSNTETLTSSSMASWRPKTGAHNEAKLEDKT